MSELNISVQWRGAVTQENGQAWCFPDKFTPYFQERYSIPAVYRWRIDKRLPGEKERIYICEAEELTRRVRWVLRPHYSSKTSDTNRRLNEIFRQCVLEKRGVWIDVADIDPFEINGIRFDQRDLGDRFKRAMLKNLLLAVASADKNCELLNDVVEPLDRDRELLIRRLSPCQVRETKERYFGSSVDVNEHLNSALTPGPRRYRARGRGGRRFKPGPKRKLTMPWTHEFFFGKSGLRELIGQIASPGSKPTWRHWAKSILIRAEQDQLSCKEELRPHWLGGFRRPGFPAKRDQDERKIFGRLLEKRGLWSPKDYKVFEEVLENELEKSQTQPAAPSSAIRCGLPNPPEELCALVSALALGCGLSTGEMQSLRVEDIRSDGLLVRPSRLISFGEGRDELPKETLERLMAHNRPTGYLFFSKSPRDHEKSAGRNTLNAAVQTLHPKDTITSLGERHFQADFDRATNLHELWSHWSNVHGVSDDHIRRLLCGRRRQKRAPALKGYVNAATVFPVSAPYFLAAICASGSIPSSSKLLQGGERRRSDFRGLVGRYDITVEWPASLFDELSSMEGRPGCQKADGALRLLYKFAWEHWLAGQRSQVKHTGRKGLWADDRELVDRFALTDVRVVDTRSGTEWSGRLFEFQSQKRGFTVPLIEEMTRGAWRGKCRACWHPQRTELDREILGVLHRKEQLVKEERFVEELTAVAERFGGELSYQSLRRHAGLNPPVPGRGNTRDRSGHSRSHIAKSSAASLTRCPRILVDRLASLRRLPLILYGLRLAIGTEDQEVSVAWIQQAIGLTTTDSEISLALNALCQSPALLESFESRQQRFLVTISKTN